MLNAKCSICGNKSGYDEESLLASTWIINGVEIILCCPCEDDLLRNIASTRLSDSTYELVEKEANLNGDGELSLEEERFGTNDN